VLQPPLVQPPLQQPPVTTSNPPVISNPIVVIRPLDPPTFSTVTQPQGPVTNNGPITVLIVPSDKPVIQGPALPQVVRRPRQYNRPTTEVLIQPQSIVDPGKTDVPLTNGLIAFGLGRHDPHQLPEFVLPDGRRQCLASGFGRRYVIGPDGTRKAIGMSPVLRGFGPIMRDVPAFSHRTAGCLILVKRREDRD
jgi:hypothetical protein